MYHNPIFHVIIIRYTTEIIYQHDCVSGVINNNMDLAI